MFNFLRHLDSTLIRQLEKLEETLSFVRIFFYRYSECSMAYGIHMLQSKYVCLLDPLCSRQRMHKHDL